MVVDAEQLAIRLGKRAEDYVAMGQEHGDVFGKVAALVLFEIASALLECAEAEQEAA